MAVSYQTYQPIVPCYENTTFVENVADGNVTTKPVNTKLTFSVIYPIPSFPDLDDDDESMPALGKLPVCYSIRQTVRL